MTGEELFLNELNFHIRQGISKKDLTDLINERLKQLTIPVVVGQSEQLVCDKKCEWTRYPKNGFWYDGCVKCGKEVVN